MPARRATRPDGNLVDADPVSQFEMPYSRTMMKLAEGEELRLRQAAANVLSPESRTDLIGDRQRKARTRRDATFKQL